MAITEQNLPRGILKQLVEDGRRCGQCGVAFTLAWDPAIPGFFLRCKDKSHNTILLAEPWDAGRRESEGVFRRNKLGTDLMQMTQEQMVDRVRKSRLSTQAITPALEQLIAEMAREYGLDPMMGEFMVYQGAPFITVAGRLRKAQETGELDGIESTAASRDEREGRGCKEGDILIKVGVFRKGCSHSFVGWGKVTGEERSKADPFLPIVKYPYDMAEKRGVARGLKKAFSIPLPSYEDIGSGEGDDITVTEPNQAESKRTRSTKAKTEQPKGEIVDTTAREVRNDPPASQAAIDANIKDAVATHAVTDAATTVKEPPKTEKVMPTCSIDPAWLTDALKKINWKEPATKSYLKATPYCLGDVSGSVYECICRLPQAQIDQFYAKIKEMVDLRGGV